jgi:ComF family protein
MRSAPKSATNLPDPSVLFGGTLRRPAVFAANAIGQASVPRRFADAVLAVLLAPACAACRTPLDEPTRGPVCSACWNAIVPFVGPVCQACGDPLPSWRIISVECSRCPRCRRRPGPIARGRAIGPYDGALRAIVHALKYGGRRSVAKALTARLTVHGADVLAGADCAVPVPLHRSRMRARGFNQAAEIARHLPVPVRHALRRVRATPSQTDLPAARRHANVRNAFALRRRAHVRGLVVVLVDDVSTTGATLNACARVLLAGGAREVRALTVARVASRSR